MNQQNIIPANPDDPCHCCGRVHRKLFLVDSHWMGKNCAEDYKLYKQNSDVNSIYWKGYERAHAKVEKMLKSA